MGILGFSITHGGRKKISLPKMRNKTIAKEVHEGKCQSRITPMFPSLSSQDDAYGVIEHGLFSE